MAAALPNDFAVPFETEGFKRVQDMRGGTGLPYGPAICPGLRAHRRRMQARSAASRCGAGRWGWGRSVRYSRLVGVPSWFWDWGGLLEIGLGGTCRVRFNCVAAGFSDDLWG